MDNLDMICNLQQINYVQLILNFMKDFCFHKENVHILLDLIQEDITHCTDRNNAIPAHLQLLILHRGSSCRYVTLLKLPVQVIMTQPYEQYLEQYINNLDS